MRSGKEKFQLKGPTSEVHSVVFSPSAEILASGGGNPDEFGDYSITIWDTKRGIKTMSL